MPDSKITALTALTAADPANDMFPIVDVSDTSMAASGTTKRISINNLLAASGTATFASATITGDLGVGTASPSTKLEVATATANTRLRINSTSVVATEYFRSGTGLWLVGSDSTNAFKIARGSNFGGSADYFSIGSATADCTWFDAAGGTRMTLNSTGLGIGASPSYKLDVLGVSAATVASGAAFRAIRSSSGDRCLIVPLAAGSGFTIQSQNAAESDFTPIIFSGSTTTFNYRTGIGTVTTGMTLDASGNLLVGTTTAPTYGKLHVANGIQVSGSGTGGFIASIDGTNLNAYLALGASFGVSNNYDVALAIGNIAAAAGKKITITNRTAGVYLDDGGTSWNAVSDERFKDIIEPISNAVSKVGLLRSVIGKLKTDDASKRRSFLIAQDVQTVLPEAVDTSNPDQLGLAYTDVIPLLVAAIKELTARVQTLEAK